MEPWVKFVWIFRIPLRSFDNMKNIGVLYKEHPKRNTKAIFHSDCRYLRYLIWKNMVVKILAKVLNSHHSIIGISKVSGKVDRHPWNVLPLEGWQVAYFSGRLVEGPRTQQVGKLRYSTRMFWNSNSQKMLDKSVSICSQPMTHQIIGPTWLFPVMAELGTL